MSALIAVASHWKTTHGECRLGMATATTERRSSAAGSAKANEAKVFRAHAATQGLCDNLINALKLLVNQQKDGDSPIQSIVTGVHEKVEEAPWMG